MNTSRVQSHNTVMPLERASASLGVKTMAVGTYGIYLALALIYFWFGGMKFTNYEAQGLVPLVSNSPLLGWVYDIFSVNFFLARSAFSRFPLGSLS